MMRRFVSSITSSKSWSETRDFGGIMDTQSPLKDANMAYLPYCSSDGHMGDTEKWGYHFRGQRNVNAMLKYLED